MLATARPTTHISREPGEGSRKALRSAVVPPRIAIGPAPIWGWISEAVEAGGGTVVASDDVGSDGLVWQRPDNPSLLADALAGAPSVRWVQLPWAGVEQVAAH